MVTRPSSSHDEKKRIIIISEKFIEFYIILSPSLERNAIDLLLLLSLL